MNSLDLVILTVLFAYAVSGYVQGFVVNLVAGAGLITGGLLAVALVPRIIGDRPPTLASSLLALGMVIGAAAIGQGIGTYFGGGIREELTWRPLRWIDAVGGAVLSMAVVLAVAWALGYSVSGTSIPYLSKASRDSMILDRVNRVMPHQASSVLKTFNETLDANLFPRYLDPFESETIVETGPPDAAVLDSPGVVRARKSVVKVVGQAVCNRGIEGSGFVFAPDRIMTNAHVVAGVTSPTVLVGDRRMTGEVVLFDPELDVAVVAVPSLGLNPLKFAATGAAGDNAAVLGYPQNGPFDARAARIRSEINLRGPNIYGKGETVRETFSIRGLVRSGNSGGPLISPDGDVYGVIFAASITDNATGYALTASQVAADASKGERATGRVSTGNCT